jgi:hypothetical protein
MPPAQFVEAVQGTNGTGASVATALITKTAGGSAWNAGASSVQRLAGDGHLEIVASETNKDRKIGFGATHNVDGSQIAHGFALGLTGYYVAESGLTPFGPFSYATGDVFRVSRVGTTVRYYKNGELVYTSAASSSGNVLVSSSLFDSGATLSGVRLYDATAASWTTLSWENVVNVSAAAGALHTTRRLTFSAPAKMRGQDQLVVLLASQGAELVSALSSTWGFVNAYTSDTNKRGLAVYRRVCTDDEPTAYTIDLAVTQETLGALLVYRGLDNTAALVGGSGVDLSAQTTFPCPSRTLTRYSDLYLGAVLQVPTVGVVAPPADGTERVEFTQNALGAPFSTLRLELFDFLANAVGATDTKRATMASSSGAAFSLALSGLAAPVAGVFSPPVAGAIGLPVEGI